MLARNTAGPILECGSGITTLVMAAANPRAEVWALEHDAGWQKKITMAARNAGGFANIRLCHAPLVDGWYTLPPDMPHKFSFALIDGPPCNESDRQGVLAAGIKADVWLLDDADRPVVKELIDALCKAHGLRKTIVDCERRGAILTKQT
jgi:hypothetical protein